MSQAIEKLKPLIVERLTAIAFIMQTEIGFPLEMFEMEIENMSMLDNLVFINSFAKRHPQINPINYSDL